jgi:predicted DsbA family dithiol-disulfide isomerase
MSQRAAIARLSRDAVYDHSMDTTAGEKRRSFAIDILSDVVCPWCFVGKRRLEAALATLATTRPEPRPRVSWHPFELNPDLPREGIERRAYIESKFGDPDRFAQSQARLGAIGAALGIGFRFDAIARQPNTLDAHRLILWAQSQRDADPLVERLFAAFFCEGRDVGDRATLAALAADCGFDAAAAAAMLDSDTLVDRVAATEGRARELGVSGVPFFIFNERVAVSGAHEPATLVDAIEQSLRDAAAI